MSSSSVPILCCPNMPPGHRITEFEHRYVQSREAHYVQASQPVLIFNADRLVRLLRTMPPWLRALHPSLAPANAMPE